MKRCWLYSLIVVLGAGCSASATVASLILVNGKVWTENPAEPTAQAVALDGPRILAVGDNAAIRKLAGPNTRVIDLHGRLLLPGFNDSHVHFLVGGGSLISVHLGTANSQAELKERISQFAKTLPEGAWLRNGLWDHQRWNPPALPSHQLIDDVSGDHPAFLWRLDGHMALVNAQAMKLAGIDRNTKDVPGGEIERDKDGNPTGILKDAATALVERVMPPLSPEEQDQAMEAGMREAAAHGVTSVQNMADTSVDEGQADIFREFQKIERAGRLTARIYEALPVRDWKTLAGAGIVAPFGSSYLRLGNLKAFADGALGSETAWMDEPFTNNLAKSGFASPDLLDVEHFYESMRLADKAGLQLTIHAIGDRANRTILDLYGRLEKDNGPADRRPRIEHAQHLHPEDYARFAKLGVIASMQPYHAIDDGRWAEAVVGTHRIKSSYAWKSLLDAGAKLAFSSDWPVAPLDPVMGIYAATTRRTLDGKNPNGWIPEQRISVAQAVHAYTMGSAFAEHQETVKGSIEPGKLSDLVVLSDDIFTIPPEAIEKTKVDMTIFDGKVIYQRGGVWLFSEDEMIRSDLGRHVYGAAAVAFGVITLVWHDFNGWQQIRALGNVPHREILVYIAAAMEIFGGVAIQFRRTARAGAAALGTIYLIFALLWVPHIVATPKIYDRWGNFFEQFSLVSGAMIVYSSVSSNDSARAAWLARSGYIGFGICVVSFTLEQLLYLSGTAGFVPKWIPPGQMFWAITTTIALALAAIAILTGRSALLASRLLTAMLIGFGLLVWLPAPFADPHKLINWAGNAQNLAITGAAWIVTDFLSQHHSDWRVHVMTNSLPIGTRKPQVVAMVIR